MRRSITPVPEKNVRRSVIPVHTNVTRSINPVAKLIKRNIAPVPMNERNVALVVRLIMGALPQS